MKTLKKSRVLVLGATSAIAQEFCRLLAPGAASFVLVGRDAAHLETVAADLRVRGSGAVFAASADLTHSELHEQLLDAAWRDLGGIDTCLLAYGVLGNQEEAEAGFDEARRIFEINFMSASSLILRIASRFSAQGSGKLAVIGSVAGDRGRKSNFIYGTSKSAIATLMEGLRHRYYGTGLRFLTVKPGMVDTPMTAHMPKTPLFASPRKVAQVIIGGLEKGKDVVYAPAFWWPIMLLIRNLPRAVFYRTKL